MYDLVTSKVDFSKNKPFALFISSLVHALLLFWLSDIWLDSEGDARAVDPINIILLEQAEKLATVPQKEVVSPVARPISKAEENDLEDKSQEKASDSRQQAVQTNFATIRNFTDSLVSEENINAEKLDRFQRSFVEQNVANRVPATQIVEHKSGKVNVKTRFFGKSVCYSFDAKADFNVVNFLRSL